MVKEKKVHCFIYVKGCVILISSIGSSSYVNPLLNPTRLSLHMVDLFPQVPILLATLLLGVLVLLTLKERRLLCMHRNVETKLHSFLVLGEHPMARKTKRLTLSTTGQAELIMVLISLRVYSRQRGALRSARFCVTSKSLLFCFSNVDSFQFKRYF